MKLVCSLALTVAALLSVQVASAHRVYFEPQAKADKPWQSPATDDFSFANPMMLDNIWGSKALFGYLTNNDVDVYAFSLPPYMGGSPMTRMLVAMTLTPACNQTKNNYVNVAVVGPGLPAPTSDLPFTVPAGYGVMVRENPILADDEEREIFYESTSNISWFMPEGMSQACIENRTPPPMSTCDLSNIIGGDIMWAPGLYYIAVWDNDGVKQDYTLSVGVVDTGYYTTTEDEHLTVNNAHLHTPCTQPYPGN